jgi:putative Mn2+ efflux pump MntP
MRKLIITITVLLSLSFSTFAQNNAGLQFFKYARQEQSVGYNFFIGEDAADFSTSIKGFGSGMGDVLTGRVSMDIIGYGTDKLSISLGLGYSVSKFRLSKNLILGLDQGSVTWMADPDETHVYQNTFFGYGKTKLVNGSFYAPLNLNISFSEKIMVCLGGFVDYSIYTKFKSKYKVGEDDVKDLIKPSDMNDFNLNKIKYGLNASLYFTGTGTGLSFTYYMTPFFQEGLGPDIQEMRICFSSGIGDIREEIAKDRGKDR